MMTQTGEPFDPYYHWLGIPADEQPPNHYRLLGINPLEGNREVIQNAADRQMAHLRTFQTGPRGTLSQKLLNEVSAARVCLLSTEKKQAYDQQLTASLAGSATASPEGPSRVPLPPGVTAATAGSGETSEGEPRHDLAFHPLFVPMSDSKQAGRTPKRLLARRRSRLPSLVTAVLGCALVGAIILCIWLFAADGPPGSQTRLVLIWPAAQRSDATLELDGRRCDLTTQAAITGDRVELELEPGSHKYRIERPGMIPLEGSFVLEAGTKVDLNISFTPIPETSRLVMRWAQQERVGTVLEIDGRAVDWASDSASIDADEIIFSLPPGDHALAIKRGETTLFSQKIALREFAKVTVPIELSSVRLHVQWDVTKRKHATLFIDGEAVDLQRDPESDRDGMLVFRLPVGKHSLRIERGASVLVDQPLELMAGKRTTINANTLMDQSASRVWLVWPAAERVGATLQVDGEEVPLAQDAEAGDEREFAVDVTPGDHTFRITHPDFEDFETTLKDIRGDVRLTVSRQPLISSRPPAEDLQRMREEFEAVYVQYDEYKQWNQESDPREKQSLLRALLERLRSTASALPRASSRQYVAYQEAYRLAATNHELVMADDILKKLRQSGCCTEQEYRTQDEKLWDEALRALDVESLVGYLKIRADDDRKPTETEQEQIVRRMVESAEGGGDYSVPEQAIGALLDMDLLSPSAASEARAKVYVAAAKASQPTPESSVQLAETMLESIPEIMEGESELRYRQADDLLDAVNVCRRRVLADRRTTDELKERADALNEDAKELRDLISQFRRAAEARQAIEASEGTAAHRKLLGLWLLQRGQFEEAIPHLRQSGDPTLVDIAVAPPAAANDLLVLADAVEAESKKSKYSKRNESALLGYALHLRQLALAKGDGTLDEDTRTIIERRVGGPAEELEWRRWPKGKWTRLLDIYSLETLRELALSPRQGTWNVLSEGTIVATKRDRSLLEIPVNLQGSYAIRFVCRRTVGESVNVNLPLGDRSVLFTLGAFSGRFSGLQMVDNTRVNDPANGASIKRSEFALRPNVPVRVEVHVDLLPAKVQSVKQKKLTGGNDWTTISILIDGRLLKRVSAATSRFSMDANYELPHDVLAFSANAIVAFSNIELMRL